MQTGAAVPVHVTPDAAEYIAGLGMQREFEQMVEHTRETVPGLLEIRVELDPDPSGTIGPGIVIWAHRRDPGPGDDMVDWHWGEWKVNTFPPEVCMQFVMLCRYEPPANGR